VNNQELRCSAKYCTHLRYGYSKYCLQHKNHISSTGSIEQPYIRELKSKLKPYVELLDAEIKKEIESNNELIRRSVKLCEQLLEHPSRLNDIHLENALSELLGRSSHQLPNKVLGMFLGFKGGGKRFLAVGISIFLFQREYPNQLLTGAPLFLHCGKLLYKHTPYTKTTSRAGRKYYSQRTLTKGQYINIGAKFYSKFSAVVDFYLRQHEAQGEASKLRVKETPLEALERELQERIEFVYDQRIKNKAITDAMAASEIRAIKAHFEQLIEEERRKVDG